MTDAQIYDEPASKARTPFSSFGASLKATPLRTVSRTGCVVFGMPFHNYTGVAPVPLGIASALRGLTTENHKPCRAVSGSKMPA